MTVQSQKQKDRVGIARHAGESGAVIVEFAVILPFLAVLFAGAIEVGFLTHDHQILQNGAREGARYASLRSNWILVEPGAQARIEQRVIDYLASEGITVVATDITIDQGAPNCIATYGGTAAPCSRVTVEYSKPLFFPGFNLLGPVTLEGNAVFRNLFE